MPLDEDENQLVLVRKLKIIKGEHNFVCEINPRFNYGKDDFITENKKGILVVRSKKNKNLSFQIISDVNFEMEVQFISQKLS